MNRIQILVIILLVLSSCKNSISYDVSEPIYRTGDNGLWRTMRGSTEKQTFGVRLQVSIKDRIHKTQPLGVQVNAFGAFDVFWDGVLIGRNGQVASQQEGEVPGTETTIYMVPDSLSKTGRHLVTLRASQAYEKHSERGVYIKLGDYSELLRMPLIIMSFMNLMAGAFLIAAIYYFFLYVNSRLKEYTILIFAVICLLFFALLITEYLKFYLDIPYTFFYIRLEVIGWLTFLIAFLVPLYFTLQFSFKRKKLLLSVLLCSLATIYVINFGHYDITAIYYSYAMWLATLVIVVNAAIQKAKGGLTVLIGLIVSAVVNYFLVYDFGLFISFTIIILCMLYLHTIRARIIEEEYQASLLLSSRLQLELLKKNIQPHFLRNTLTSMMDWVEESPRQGAEFIQALAGEFDIMNEIAEQSLIPIRQEIELCRRLLSIMQFRKELRYDWEETGIDEIERIPPAILHTIIENGITHSIPLSDGSVKFKLLFERGPGFKQYSIETIGENRPQLPGRTGGNGFRYIRARLTESYSDRWEFHSEGTSKGWLSTIKLFNNPL